jgi:hypothetical protein
MWWSRPAAAQSCTTLINDQIAYLDSHGPDTIQVTAVTNQAASWRNRPTLASYTTAFLRASAPLLQCNKDFTSCWFVRWLQSLQGGRQLFNDRTRLLNHGTSLYRQEFDALTPDDLGIFITQDGEAYVQLNSWGRGTIRIPSLSCANGVMYGFDVHGVMYVLAFSQHDPPPG